MSSMMRRWASAPKKSIELSGWNSVISCSPRGQLPMIAGQRSAPNGSVVWITPWPFSHSARARVSVVPANNVPTSATTLGRSMRIKEKRIAREWGPISERDG